MREVEIGRHGTPRDSVVRLDPDDLVDLVGRHALVIDSDNQIAFAGATATALFGTDIVGQNIENLLDDDLGPLDVGSIRSVVTRDGQELTVDAQSARVGDGDGAIWQVRSTIPITSATDGLTGLPVSGAFLDELADELARTADSGERAAVYVIDVDRFRLANDRLGHDNGDALLRLIGVRFAQVLDARDVLARLAGDEFVVMRRNIASVAEAIELAERLLGCLDKPFRIGANDLPITASIGIATSDDVEIGTGAPDRGTASSLVNRADAAVTRSKEQGRARWTLFDDQMRRWADDRDSIERRLRGAVNRQELELVYQPVLDVADAKVHGVEALLRWHQPGGVIAPDEFIGIAETTGLIVPIGLWVVEEASRQLSQWDKRWPGSDLTMAINVSARQLEEDDLVDSLIRIVGASGLSPSRFELEITESVLHGDADEAMDVLRRLRAVGFGLAMDDFGTGYSSLTYLRKFPIDTVKIDRSFVAPVNETNDDSTIVSMIVALARSLQLKVVAEGVESFEQAATLYALKCDYGQGYYWSRPMSADAATDWLGDRLSPSSVRSPQ